MDTATADGSTLKELRKLQTENTSIARESNTRLILTLIIVFSIGLDLLFFTGFYASDDIGYLGGAIKLLRDGGYTMTHANSRLTLVGWNLLGTYVFGWNAQPIAATYVVFHQVLNLLIFLLARRLFDKNVGLMAAYGVATLPLIIIFSTCIMPDIPVACFCVLSLYAFLRGLDQRRYKRQRSACLWLLFAGISVGLAYMAKESALVLLPFYLVLWLVSERKERKLPAVKRGASFAAGFFAVMIIETITLSWIAGELHFRLGWTTQPVAEEECKYLGRHGTAPLERLDSLDNRFNGNFLPPGYKTLMLGSLLLFPVVCRRRWVIYLLAIWFFTYFTWGTMNLGRYLPTSISPRYYIPVIVFFIIVYAAVFVGSLDWITARINSSRLRVLVRFVAIAFAIIHPLFGLSGPDWVAGRSYKAGWVGKTTKAIQHAVQQDDRPIILSDYLTQRMYRLEQAQSVTRVVLNPYVSEGAPFRAILDGGSWFFVAVDPAWPHTTPGPGSMNAIMHWFVDHCAPERRKDSVTELPPVNSHLVWSMHTPVAEIVEFQGYEISARQIQRFTLPGNRIDNLAAHHFRMINNWAISPRPEAKSVLLLDMGSCPMPRARQLAPNTYGSLTLRPGQWNISQQGPETTLHRTETGGFKLTRPLTSEQHLWLIPRQGSPCADFSVDRNAFCEYVIDIHRTSKISATLIVDTQADTGTDTEASPSTTQPHSNRLRFRLKRGENRFRIHAPDGPIVCTPAIKVRGGGDLTIERLAINRMPRTYHRNLTNRLGDFGLSKYREQCRLRRNPHGGPNLQFRLPPREETLLQLPESADPLLVELPPRGRLDFSLSTELVKLTDETHVELDFEVFHDSAMEELAFHRHIRIEAGLNEFSLNTMGTQLFARLVFRIAGRGRFEIRRFVITSTEPIALPESDEGDKDNESEKTLSPSRPIPGESPSASRPN